MIQVKRQKKIVNFTLKSLKNQSQSGRVNLKYDLKACAQALVSCLWNSKLISKNQRYAKDPKLQNKGIF
jgi:hypothetical protein